MDAVVNAVRPHYFFLFSFFCYQFRLKDLASLSHLPSLSHLDLIYGCTCFIPGSTTSGYAPYTPLGLRALLLCRTLVIVPLFPLSPQLPICGRCCSSSLIYLATGFPVLCLISLCIQVHIPSRPVPVSIPDFVYTDIVHCSLHCSCPLPSVCSPPH
jgi:hypothetical protein